MAPEQNTPETEELKEVEELLKENLELNKANNEMLKGMERSARWGLIMSVIKWTVIIGSAFGAYYYFGQLLTDTLQLYKRMLSGQGSSSATSTTPINIDIEALKTRFEKFEEVFKRL